MSMWKLSGERSDAALSGAVDGAVVGGAASALAAVPTGVLTKADRGERLAALRELARPSAVVEGLRDRDVRTIIRRFGMFGVPAGALVGAGVGAMRGRGSDGAADGAIAGAAYGAGAAALSTVPAAAYYGLREGGCGRVSSALRAPAVAACGMLGLRFDPEKRRYARRFVRNAAMAAIPTALAVGAGIGALRRRLNDVDGRK